MSAKWQPIETAPKDGARIGATLFNDWVRENGIQQIDVVYWVAWPEPQPDGVEGDWSAVNYEPLDEYTHWTPIPEPPA